MPGWRDQPALFRHCVVAIFNKGVTGGGADGVVRAMRMARDVLARQGHLYHGGTQQVLQGIRLTGKGFAQNAKHLREGMEGDRKDRAYERLFKMIEPRLYELDGPGGVQPPKPVNTPGNAQAGINMNAPQPRPRPGAKAPTNGYASAPKGPPPKK